MTSDVQFYFMSKIKLGFYFKSMTVRKSDIWVVTFPKSGTTWMQELVWQVVNNCDFDKGKKTTLDERFPCLEMQKALGKHFQGVSVGDPIDEMSDPRLIKSHMPLSLLPNNLLDTAKVIYVARNPMDVMIRKG